MVHGAPNALRSLVQVLRPTFLAGFSKQRFLQAVKRCFIREVLLSAGHSMGNEALDRLEISSCSTSYMFDERKSVGNPDRITYCGAVEDNQQHFPEEAPKMD